MLMASTSLQNRDSFTSTDQAHSRPTVDHLMGEAPMKIIDKEHPTLDRVDHVKKIIKISYTESSTFCQIQPICMIQRKICSQEAWVSPSQRLTDQPVVVERFTSMSTVLSFTQPTTVELQTCNSNPMASHWKRKMMKTTLMAAVAATSSSTLGASIRGTLFQDCPRSPPSADMERIKAMEAREELSC